MKFGVFDHMDRGTVPLAEQYENRLRLVEAYERHGFHMYHLAEHHATPLGMAPSPSVFLSAVAQRTSRLRFGPLVYTLPMYHPLRAAEEICMLDQLSNGRLEIGVGRGISAHELTYYGVDPAQAQPRYVEAFSVVRAALTGKVLNHAGTFYTFRDVPIEIEPVQKPHPPLWYGVSGPDGVPWAAQNAVNVVCNVPAAKARAIADRYRAEWAALGRTPETMPCVGFNRHVVIADSDAEATAIARRAYAHWHHNFFALFRKHGTKPPFALYPEHFDALQEMGLGIAGTPERVRDTLAAQVAETGTNYLVCRLAFGDLTFAESMRSLEGYAEAVMPALMAQRELRRVG